MQEKGAKAIQNVLLQVPAFFKTKNANHTRSYQTRNHPEAKFGVNEVAVAQHAHRILHERTGTYQVQTHKKQQHQTMPDMVTLQEIRTFTSS